MNRHSRRPASPERRPRAWRFLGPLTLTLLTGALATTATATAAVPAPHEAVTQPPAPTSGPGSVDYRHRGWRKTLVGRGANAAYVFAPTRPGPRTAPLAVITHGYYEFSGYDQMYELVRHTVLAGNVVIYPRYQTGEAAPCPGPFNIEPCMSAATKGIDKALTFLADHPAWTQPDLDRTSYFGFSFGGIITANLANRWKKLNLPRPRAVFLDDPEDSGLAGAGEPALDASLAGIPKDTRFVCHSGADGALVLNPTGGSCNTVYPRLSSIPTRNKALVMTRTDAHGSPALSSAHGVCAGSKGTADAYDWGFCWRVWDAIRADAYTGRWHQYAFGDGRKNTSLGQWSDGTPVTPLTVAATKLEP